MSDPYYCRTHDPWPEALETVETVLRESGFVDCTNDAEKFAECMENYTNCFRRHFCTGSCCDDGPNLDICYNTSTVYVITNIQFPL